MRSKILAAVLVPFKATANRQPPLFEGGAIKPVPTLREEWYTDGEELVSSAVFRHLGVPDSPSPQGHMLG